MKGTMEAAMRVKLQFLVAELDALAAQAKKGIV
jgi:hypothetical protein